MPAFWRAKQFNHAPQELALVTNVARLDLLWVRGGTLRGTQKQNKKSFLIGSARLNLIEAFQSSRALRLAPHPASEL